MKSAPSFMLAVCSAVFIVASCSSSEIGNSKDVNPETVYQQYTLSYDETEQQVEGLAVFRFAGKDGTTLVLSNPSNITFDNTLIKVDSNDFAGAFYGFKLPAGSFNRKHQFVFTDLTNRKYSNEFDAAIPRLKALPLKVSKEEPISIYIEDLADGEYTAEVSTSGTDSSFSISSSNNKPDFIEIPVSELVRQKGNKLTLNFSVSRKLPLQQTTKEGGSLLLEYILKPVTIELDESIPVSLTGKKLK